jgi:hypothetical protein
MTRIMGGLGLGARRAVQSVVKRAIAQGPASGSWRHSNAISDIANRARLRRRRHQEQGAHSMGGAIPLGAGDWVVARWQPDDPYPAIVISRAGDDLSLQYDDGDREATDTSKCREP